MFSHGQSRLRLARLRLEVQRLVRIVGKQLGQFRERRQLLAGLDHRDRRRRHRRTPGGRGRGCGLTGRRRTLSSTPWCPSRRRRRGRAAASSTERARAGGRRRAQFSILMTGPSPSVVHTPEGPIPPKHEDRPSGRSHQWLPAGLRWPQVPPADHRLPCAALHAQESRMGGGLRPYGAEFKRLGEGEGPRPPVSRPGRRGRPTVHACTSRAFMTERDPSVVAILAPTARDSERHRRADVGVADPLR